MKAKIIVAMLLGLLLPTFAAAKETKDVLFKFKNADPVMFSHDLHLLKYNNNCRICHNAIFNLKQRQHYTMADMEKTKSCGGCHTGIKAFSVADEKSCSRCHTGKPRTVTYRIKGATEATFSHDVHIMVTDGKCKKCHDGKVIPARRGKPVTMAEMEKGKTCGSCHNGKTAFTVAGNCGNCHKGMKPREMAFKVKGATDAVFSHAFHLEAYKCADCHTKLFAYKAGAKRYSMADMAKGKSCGACHNGKDAFSSGGDCAKCHKGFKPGNITYKVEVGGDATFSHAFHLEAYKCADCHTKTFPYKAGTKKATMNDMEEGKSCGACHNGKDAFSVAGDCIKCHNMK